MNTREGVIELDEQYLVKKINPAAERICGQLQEDVSGKKIHEILELRAADKTSVSIYQEMKSCLNGTCDAPRTFRYELLRESGTAVHIEMRCLPKRDKGADRGSFVFLSDLTLKDRMEDQLYHDQVMESFGFLASGITHDFNNVINSVSVAAQILEERLDTDDQRPWSFSVLYPVLQTEQKL